MASRLLVLLAILCVTFLILDFMLNFWKDGKAVVDHHDDCKHHCEWQLAQMNETFKILITVCQEKLQKLHGSDMNLAIIREQLHKEILELFWYEFQTFQRLHSSRIETVPQFCLEYCTAMNNAKHKECKENVTNNHFHIQMLLQRERWLRSHIHRRLWLIRGNVNSVESETLSVLWPSIIAIVIALVTLFYYVMVVKPTRSRIVALTGEKERIEAQLHRTQTQLHVLQTQAESSVTRPEETEELCDNQCLKLSTSDERILKSRIAELCFEKDLLSKEYQKAIALKDKSLKNVDKFWHQRLNEERKVRRAAEEKETLSVESIKIIESKHQWQLAREITRYQSAINKLKAKLKKAQERDAEGEQIMLQRQEELERKVREFERETKFLQLELEGSKMDLSMETMRKNRALAHVSDLEKEVNALRLQTTRLVEGALKKGSKASKPSLSASHHHTHSAQESNSLQVIDSRLEDIRRNFESRFTQLQNKFDDQVTRDSEELCMLRLEHQQLCERLEQANRRNIQLERRLAYQDPIQSSCRKNGNERISRMRRWISPRQRLLRKRSNSIDLERNDSFLTQPEYEPGSVQDLTDYSYYCLSVC